MNIDSVALSSCLTTTNSFFVNNFRKIDQFSRLLTICVFHLTWKKGSNLLENKENLNNRFRDPLTHPFKKVKENEISWDKTKWLVLYASQNSHSYNNITVNCAVSRSGLSEFHVALLHSSSWAPSYHAVSAAAADVEEVNKLHWNEIKSITLISTLPYLSKQ